LVLAAVATIALMLAEALTALAATAGVAAVQAAVDDGYGGARRRIVRLLARGDRRRQQATIKELARTAQAIRAAAPDAVAQVREQQETYWRQRWEALLEAAGQVEREKLVAELAELSAARGTTGGGNTTVKAGDGSVAAAVLNNYGSLTITNPSPAGPLPGQGGPSSFWPRQFGVVPRLAHSYQERGLLEQGTGCGNAQCLVLTGAAGVGKTQAAAHHARSLWSRGEVDLLVWVNAANRDSVVAAFADAAGEILGTDPGDADRAAAAFLSWLQPRSGADRRCWLIVLDDVAAAQDLRGLWPPLDGDGQTVVTTRSRDAALTGAGAVVQVGAYDEAMAVAYLTDRLRVHGLRESADQVAALAADLGRLPLALSQAAAFLVDAGLDCARYRALLADRARVLADVLPEPAALPDDQTATVAAACSLAVERADSLRPAGMSRPMLELAAVLDPNGIPESVLTADPAIGYLSKVARRTATREDAVGGLRALHRLNLVDHDPGPAAGSVRVHRLTQRAARDELPADRYHAVVGAVADALVDAWPTEESQPLPVWPAEEPHPAPAEALRANAEALRANAGALRELAGEALWRPEPHPVLFRLGISLDDAGLVAAAGRYWQDLDSVARHTIEPYHPDALGIRLRLAHWRGAAGTDARTMVVSFTELLHDFVGIFGADAVETLAVRAGLAWWRGAAGDANGAADAFEDLVDRYERRWPEFADSPRVTEALQQAAHWRRAAGDHAGVAKVLSRFERMASLAGGPRRIQGLVARRHLATTRGVAGDPAGAAASLARLIDDYRFVFGPDNPVTFSVRIEWADWRGEAADPAGAATALAGLVAECRQKLSPDAEPTLGALGRLAHWRQATGDHAGASAPLAELVDAYTRRYGHTHAETLTARVRYAVNLGEAGKADAAVTCLIGILPDFERIFGPDHRLTAQVRQELQRWRAPSDPI
jgi:hypothetical protein